MPVTVFVGVAVEVSGGVTVDVSVRVIDAVRVGVRLAVGGTVSVALCVGLGGTVAVTLFVGVTVGVRLGACVRVGVAGGSGVSVAVGLAVGGTNSYEPMSQIALPSPSPSMGRTKPRWSVVKGAPRLSLQPPGLPPSIAGLPDSSACVCVGPPLFASASRSGSLTVTGPSIVQFLLNTMLWP